MLANWQKPLMVHILYWNPPTPPKKQGYTVHNRFKAKISKCEGKIKYLCSYDLYGPVRNAFDAGSIHYESK
jgi:hypothetical protein